ncbi:MAG: PstS family phosphate ABC transporter substrate-binding protein [Trueperaceae bacterium]|nr:PstS family phosphate ABC transporter substrate-binding protein [Trueperaceae bacterium]
MKKFFSLLIVIAGLAYAQDVNIAGSSTVYPISLGMAEEFNIETGLEVAVASTGTGGGFKSFCAGETDISDASRPIKEGELEACAANGLDNIIEIKVAWDALTVAVSPENDFVDCMTYDQLAKIWQRDDNANHVWVDYIEGAPLETINLYGPSTGSGTLDYFVEEVLGTVYGEEANHTAAYFPSEEDDVLAENVSQDPYAMVYLGYAYYASDPDRLKALAIQNDAGECVLPSTAHIEDGTYPLSRPIFIYTDASILAEKPAVKEFIEFYLDAANRSIIADTGYAVLNDAEYEASLEAIQ